MKKEYSFLILAFSVIYLAILMVPGWGESFFVIDDTDLFIVPYLQHPWNWQSFVSLMTPGNTLDYLPVRDLSTWIDWTISSNLLEFTAPAKIQNFFWLVGSCYFLYRILFQVSDSRIAASLIAASWLLHPMHFESLQWISARKDLMAWFFMLAAVFYFLEAYKEKKEAGWKVVFLYLLCIYSKATFILTAPAVLFFVFVKKFLLKEKGSERLPYRTLVACSLVSVFSLLFQVWNYTSSNNMRINLSTQHKFLAMLAGLGRYFTGIFFPPANAIDVENWGSWYLYNFNYVFAGLLLILIFGFLVVKTIKSGKTEHGLVLFFTLGVLAVTPGINWMHRSFYSVRYFEPFLILIFGGAGLWIYRKKQVAGLIAMYIAVLGLSFYDSVNWTGNREMLSKAVAHSPQNPSVGHKKLMYEFYLFLSSRLSDAEEVKFRSDFQRLVETCFVTDLSNFKTECRGMYGGAHAIAKELGYSKEESMRLLVRGKSFMQLSNRLEFPWREDSDAQFSEFIRNQKDDKLDKDALVKFVSLYNFFPTVNLRAMNILKVCFQLGNPQARELTASYLRSYLIDTLAISEVLAEFKSAKVKNEVYGCFYEPKSYQK